MQSFVDKINNLTDSLKKNDPLSHVTDVIKQYLYPDEHNNFYFWDERDSKYALYDRQQIKDLVVNKVDKRVGTWILKECPMYRVVNELNKPRFYDSCINICKGFKHDCNKLYDDCSDTAKDGVQTYLQYIKDVLVSTEDQYKYLLQWIAYIAHGKKNDSALYLRASAQGIGKSTFPDFLKEWVYGAQLCCDSEPRHLLTSFNKILEGKVLCVFEEMPAVSQSEWLQLSSELKKAITATTKNYSDKFVKQYEAKNINNYMIVSNNDAIKDSNGRRYFILDLNTQHKDNWEYFGNIRKKCFNDETGNAFFLYLLQKVDLTDYYSQNMPITDAKKDEVSSRLDNVSAFVKSEFVLKQKAMNSIVVQDLFDQFVRFAYVDGDKKNKLNKIQFCAKLKELGINYQKSGSKNIYKVTLDVLQSIADKGRWLHELDEVTNATADIMDDPLEHGVETETTKLIKQLRLENEQLKKELLESRTQNTPKPIVSNVTQSLLLNFAKIQD